MVLINDKSYKFAFLLAVVIVFTLLLTLSNHNVLAADIIPKPDAPVNTNATVDCNSTNCGNYSLNSFVELTINIAQFLLGIVGSLALLFFIYGGIKMIIAAGSSDKIEEAKNIIRNAVIGLIIVFVSWSIINFVYYSLVRNTDTDSKKWYQVP